MKYLWLRDRMNEFKESDPVPFMMEPVEPKDIVQAEKTLGLEFDSDLKEFWLDVGCGLFRREHPLQNNGEVVEFSTLFSHPLDIVDTMLLDPESFQGCVPFFDISDGNWLVIREDSSIMFDDLSGPVLAKDVDDFIKKIFENSQFFCS